LEEYRVVLGIGRPRGFAGGEVRDTNSGSDKAADDEEPEER